MFAYSGAEWNVSERNDSRPKAGAFGRLSFWRGLRKYLLIFWISGNFGGAILKTFGLQIAESVFRN